MKVVYIAHPFTNDPEGNMRKVAGICRDLPEDIVPISPIHNFSFLKEPDDREKALPMCLILLSRADEVWVYGDYKNSTGCQAEISMAETLGIPIIYKS